MAQIVMCLPTMWETQVQSLGWEDLLEKEMATHSSILAGKFHGWRNLVGYCPWDDPHKNTGMGCHFLLQEIFPTQGLNLGLPHCRQMLYHLSHKMGLVLDK